MTAAETLRALAVDIMGARLPVLLRKDVVAELYHQAAALDELPRPSHPDAARALDLTHLQKALNTVEFMVRPYSPTVANRLLEALDLTQDHCDTAQVELLRLSGLPVNYQRPGDLGARLARGEASTLDILSLAVLVKRDSPLIHPPERP